jgi:prepilin-type N-terminal cleavage/methylation domain-containing protein
MTFLMRRSSYIKGFSLLELSIVLSIIALIAGGIITGKSVMENAKLKRIIVDINTYREAVQNFSDKYGELPGDFSRATEIWGSAFGTGNDSSCYMINSLSLTNTKLTCNGNGNGTIEYPDPTVPDQGNTTLWFFNERYRAWQHLANSGLISGAYSGTQFGTSSTGIKTGESAPGSSFGPQAAYQFVGFHRTILSGHAHYYDRLYDFNTLSLFWTFTAGDRTNFTSKQFFELDNKLDDGKPSTGNIFTTKSTSVWQPGCTISDSVSSASYNIASTDTLCGLLLFVM